MARSLFADLSYHFFWLRKPKLLDRYLTITVAKCDTEQRQCNSAENEWIYNNSLDAEAISDSGHSKK